jgi:hypothetical protein
MLNFRVHAKIQNERKEMRSSPIVVNCAHGVKSLVKTACLGTCFVVIVLVFFSSNKDVVKAQPKEHSPFSKTDFTLECRQRAAARSHNVLVSVATLSTMPLVLNMLASLICTDKIEELVLVADDLETSEVLSRNSIRHVLPGGAKQWGFRNQFIHNVFHGNHSRGLAGVELTYLDPGNVLLIRERNNVGSKFRCSNSVEMNSSHFQGQLCAVGLRDTAIST